MALKHYSFFKIILILIIVISTTNCTDTDCCVYLSTKKISEGIYLEKYRVYCGGVYGGDVVDSYLTDSVSFRAKVGNELDHNSFTVIEADGSYFGLLYEFHRKEVILNKTSFKLSNLSFSEFDSTNYSYQPLVGELLFNCNNHSKFRNRDYGIHNSQYKVKTTQFQCDDNGAKKYYNAFFLINEDNQWLLMYNYEMDKWSKGKTHFNYRVNKEDLLIEEYELVPQIDTIKYKQIDLIKLKSNSKAKLKPVCNYNRLDEK